MPESTLISVVRRNRTLAGHWCSSLTIARAMRMLASLKLTLAGLFALGIATLCATPGLEHAEWFVSASLLLLAVNLAAAIGVNPAFRIKPALFGFHVG